MIIKTISHKSNRKSSIQKLIRYVFNPEKLQDNLHNRKPLIMKQFIRGFDMEKWADIYKNNDENRVFEHAKRTVIRHEIMSFSDKSNAYLTRDKLKTLTKFYIKNRAPKSIITAGVHYDSTIHIHFIISGVNVEGKSTRVSREDFKAFKIRLQEFQQQEFPELADSIVNHRKKKV